MAIMPGFTVASVTNYQLFQGLQFADMAQTQTLYFDYKLQEASVEISISSQANNKPRYHYKAVLIMQKVLDNAKATAWFKEHDAQSASAFYNNGALFHGKNLQAIEKVLAINKQGIAVMLKASTTNSVAIGDSVYQAALIYSFVQCGLGSLPMAAKAWSRFSVDNKSQIFIELKLISQTAQKLVFDGQIFNHNKQLLAEIAGIEMACKEGLTEQFLKKN